MSDSGHAFFSKGISDGLLPLPASISSNQIKLQFGVQKLDQLLCSSCKTEITYEEAIKLPCKHKYCPICMINNLEITLEQLKPTLLSCLECKCVIPYLVLYTIVEDSSLKEYIRNISPLVSKEIVQLACTLCGNNHKTTIKDEEFVCNYCTSQFCAKCLISHKDFGTCAEFFEEFLREVQQKPCQNCKSPGLTDIGCSCSFCKHCLVRHIKKSVLKAPLREITCEFCNKTLPKSLIYDLFQSKAVFIKFQEDSLLAPRFNCQICLEEFLVEGSITLDCDHRFCESCFKAYLISIFNAGNVDIQKIKCPECPKLIEYSIIQAAIAGSVIEANELRMIRKLSKYGENEVLKICYNCNYMAYIDKKLKKFKCPNCNLAYCPNCNKRHKRGNKCDTQNKILTISDVKTAEMNKKGLGEMENTVVCKCPKCGEAVIKEGGCNFIACPWPKCANEVFFCAICQQLLKVLFT
jgi:hypothetical protein